MSRIRTVTYLFDPLCGWCYGASLAVASLSDVGDLVLEMVPTGLFSGAGARPLDESFAAHAWANDQRIHALTGQIFSERYRTGVLADRSQRLDSGSATLALTSVALTAPDREFAALAAIQSARYVDGRDITAAAVLADVLAGLGLDAAASLFTEGTEELTVADAARVERGRQLMATYRANGVPTLLFDDGSHRRRLDSEILFSKPGRLAALLRAL
ncbi:DsbA family protein (plasmid) [Azospirillum oryzae]|uniref:DsbA family protein n=1 Tax=Azospirillum oryzae TaxID=286727 RepID=A0A6N1AC49_9PROT|nr:DsbA family protein [Azospirillum oryzae]KAA0588220.1 DsbA family protein [Azospirillum oryzae]QKS49261.1 DsbA family protein [Azospirillum oryzae]GLR82426.1 DsbA family protein [Azospirillum oryzae]